MRCELCDEPYVEGGYCGECGHAFPAMSVAERIALTRPASSTPPTPPTDPELASTPNFLGGPPR